MNALAPPIVRRRGFAVPQGLAGPVAAILAAAAVAVLIAGRTDAGPSVYLMNLVGQVAVYGLLAVALDLIWGYAGILSLGHGLYFAIGGYLIAMHLVTVAFHTSGTPPDFMLFMGWTELPAYYAGMDALAYSAVLILLLPALVAFLFGLVSFRSRVTGVYFAIITQAIAAILTILIVGQQGYTGGINGITDLRTLKGWDIRTDEAKLVLYFVNAALLLGCILLCLVVRRSKLGRILVALRDKEDRVRFSGYDVANFKTFVFCLAAALAGVGGAMFTLQVGFMSPSFVGIVPSIELVIYCAVGGRLSLLGAVYGTLLVNWAKTSFSESFPELWLFAMGALFIGVVMAFPNGLAGLFQSHVVPRLERLRGRGLPPVPGPTRMAAE